MTSKIQNRTSSALGTEAKPTQARARDFFTLMACSSQKSALTQVHPTLPQVTATSVTLVQLTHQAHTACQRCLPALPELSAPLTHSAW